MKHAFTNCMPVPIQASIHLIHRKTSVKRNLFMKPNIPPLLTPLLSISTLLCLNLLLNNCQPNKRATSSIHPNKERIITIGSSITETVSALGLTDSIVAVDTTSTQPKTILSLPKVGYLRNLNAEGILAMKPTWILHSSDAGPKATFTKLNQIGVNTHMIPSPKTLKDIYHQITQIGSLTGTQKKSIIPREIHPKNRP